MNQVYLPKPEPKRDWGRTRSRLLAAATPPSGKGWVEIAAPIWQMSHCGVFQPFLEEVLFSVRCLWPSLGDGGWGKKGAGGE